MNLYSISSIFVLGTCLLITILCLLRNKGREQDFIWVLFCLMATIWGIGSLGFSSTKNYKNAYLFWQIANICTIFAPTFYTHFIFKFLDISRKKLLVTIYVCSFLLIFIVFLNPTLFLGDLRFAFNEFYIVDWLSKKNFLYLFFYIMYYWVLLIYDCFLLIDRYRKEVGVKREQLKYILLGSFFGWVGGHGIFPAVFGINIYPVSNILIGFYPLVITYAIAKYRLMDIKLVFTRAGIFLLIYALILGVPVWIGLKLLGKGLWLLPMALMGFFATLGPFIYFYFQKRAEDQILKEQRSYQTTLRQASGGMGRIKDLNKLLYMIVYVLTRTIRLEYAAIYIYNPNKKSYVLGAFKNRSSNLNFTEFISEEHLIIDFLNKNHLPIVYEEISQKAKDFKDSRLSSVEAIMKELKAELIMPIYTNNNLTAIVTMGSKDSRKVYTEDDLSVFSILSNHASLAIENAQFYEDMKLTQQQLFQAEKMATIGIMADGLSHQINNRFHAMGFIAGDALDTIKLSKDLEMSDKMKEVMAEMEKALTRVQENVTQGGEVVQGLLKYTRKGEEGFSPVDVDAVLSSAYEMAQFKIKNHQMSLVRDYDSITLPRVKGNSTQLQEVFFNLIDNAYDAMMQRKNDLKEPEFHPTLVIHAKARGKVLEMVFEDNGTGVKDEDVQKLFTPFFTTKLSSKKGTGLGLYVIRKIIEDNHQGTVEFSSKYMVGTKMKIVLPIADLEKLI